MTLPSFQQMMLPALYCACLRLEEMHVARLEEDVARMLKLSNDDVSRRLPNGEQTAFANRFNWARLYLCKAGLLEATRRGFVRGTERGRDLIAGGVHEIDVRVLSRYPEFVDWRRKQTSRSPADAPGPAESPEERIAAAFDRLNAELVREIIARVHAFNPAFFERLIVDLLIRMGYGGGRSEMGLSLGRSGDGGVDGVIREDALGLDVVYVQAKRFAEERGVPMREIRDFIGGLEANRATKGVFVTTSFFPASAYDFVTRVPKRVALIDGPELANLMIRHRVGVRVQATYEVKRVDEGYFVD